MHQRTSLVCSALLLLSVSCSSPEATKSRDVGTGDAGMDVGTPGDVAVSAPDGSVVPDAASPTGLPDANVQSVVRLPIRPVAVAALADGWAVVGELSEEATIGGETFAPPATRFLVVRTDSDGQPTWAQGIVAPDRDDELQSVAVDDEGNVYVTLLSYSSSLDFGDEVTIAGDNITQVGFLAKFDATGTTLWAQRFYAESGIANIGVTTGGGRLVVSGTYAIWNPLEYRSASGLEVGPEFNRGANRTSFALDLDPATGLANWLSLWSAPSEGAVTTSAVLLNGDLVVAGHFEGGPLEDPTDTTYTTNTEGGFVASLDATGAIGWVRVIEGALNLHVATDGTMLAATSGFVDPINFGEGELGLGPATFFTEVVPADGSIGAGGVFGDGQTVASMAFPAAGPVLLIRSSMPSGQGQLGDEPLPAEPGAYIAGFRADWFPLFLEFFPSAEPNPVTPLAIAGRGDNLAVVGQFSGSHDFGAGPVEAGAESAGFIAIYLP